MIRGAIALGMSLVAGTSAARADCYSFEKAPELVGQIVCIRGRVVKVSGSSGRTHYLNFCDNYLTCPFTVVVFPGKLSDIGDVRTLAEQTIEIEGEVKLYNGRPEIILSEADQLRGKVANRIPPLPKDYDVARHGTFSAGKFRAKKPKRSRTSALNRDSSDPMEDLSIPD